MQLKSEIWDVEDCKIKSQLQDKPAKSEKQEAYYHSAATAALSSASACFKVRSFGPRLWRLWSRT